MSVHRLIDVMCSDHIEQARHRWPVLGSLGALRDTCQACRSYPLKPGDIARVFQGLDGETRLEIVAYHEAAHAVVGVLTGHPLCEVVVGIPRGRVRSDSGADGWVKWECYDVPVADNLAMLAAGQEAVLRWLADAALTSTAHLIDARYGGWHDNVQAAEWITKYGLAPDIGHGPAQDSLDRHWGTVRNLATRLRDRYRVSGDDVRTMLGIAH